MQNACTNNIHTSIYMYRQNTNNLMFSLFTNSKEIHLFHALRVQDKFKYHTINLFTNNYMYWVILITIFADSFNKYFIRHALLGLYIICIVVKIRDCRNITNPNKLVLFYTESTLQAKGFWSVLYCTFVEEQSRWLKPLASEDDAKCDCQQQLQWFN